MQSKIILESIKNSFLILNPLRQVKNPVMFVVYIGAIVTTFYTVDEILYRTFSWFNLQMTLWMWFTVLFANFAQSLAESRGKAQASSLKKVQVEAQARVIEEGKEKLLPASRLKKGMIIFCKAGDIIPADGEVVEGIATVDESAITGESAPVIRESGGDRSAVTAGTKMVSDSVKIEVTSEAGGTFLDRIIQLVEGAKRQKTANEIALNILLSSVTIVFLLSVSSLKLFLNYSARNWNGYETSLSLVTLPVLISLLVCLIPTTISALLNAIGISGMDRMIQKNVIAKSGQSVEAAGDVDVLLLDKTGTITLGNRMAVQFISTPGIEEKELARLSQMASLSDETPEGRSIVILAKNQFNLRAEDVDTSSLLFVPFSAETAMSGVDVLNKNGSVEKSIRKGSIEAIVSYIKNSGGVIPGHFLKEAEAIAKQGGTPLLVSEGSQIKGAIALKDVVKGGIKARFDQLRQMGIRTVMVTGDNPLTAAAIAAEAGVDDFIALATPEMKLARIQYEQSLGHLVAMAGDGTNDAPALAQADVGVAMNTGTQPSREAGNMVDLDSNPTKLIEIIEIGKQLLMTRGALTTFSIANDIAKSFAILPALFSSLYMTEGNPAPLAFLNVMRLHSPQSAILSATIFNALIIVLLIPLALKGVNYVARSAQDLLTRNVLIYGLGGIVAPFLGIKLIDLFIQFIGSFI